MTPRRARGAGSSFFALLAVVGLAVVGLGMATIAAAAPPDPIPQHAWAAAQSLPLADTEHWPDLASVAEPLDGRPFFAEEICGFNPSPKRQFSSDQARARVDQGPGKWSLQQQIVHFPGEAASSSERAGALFSSVVDALARCPAQVPGAAVDVTTQPGSCAPQRCTQTAAVVRTPDGVTAHVYLAVAGGSVAELTVFSAGAPDVPWVAPADDAVLAAIIGPVCATWEC
ncbi:hypothetical protein MI170_30320 [Mycolicibacterium goodii]|uniref:hypothetical protein n=1 Tax=Mycolicibacterium goodii TaxID=134601 RepID=UPI001F03C1D7|nr:hypothetical protein [Mycolicibacterium goodii]ULN47488.1 hypothetical protein MI170_30320 [Mycolicibacterium goodii]